MEETTKEALNSVDVDSKTRYLLQAKINSLKKPDDYDESENPKWESLSPSDKWLVYNSSEISNGLHEVMQEVSSTLKSF